MARITDIYLVETREQHMAVIHTQASAADIPAVIGAGFTKLVSAVRGSGIMPCDTPFLRITGDDPGMLEITMGVETPRPPAQTGDIRHVILPAGKRAFCYWLGDNADLSSLAGDMQKFAGLCGHKLTEGL